MSGTQQTWIPDRPTAAEPDPALTALVRAVDNVSHGFEVSVTLHVCGVLVCGLMISGRTYFELLQDVLRQADADFLSGWTDAFADRFPAGVSHEDAAGNDAPPSKEPPTGFVHLRAATVHAPGATPLPDMLWRGRLAHVSGWSIGTYTEKPPPS
jgi:hypothetical protein